MAHTIHIAPSLLSADFSKLGEDIRLLEAAGADVLHIDVMDGHFVPNITLGPVVVQSIRPVSSMPFDCHLMIKNPDAYIPHFVKAGADWISVHAEECVHLHRTIGLIKECGAKAGVALNPVTPISTIFDAAEYCDFILLMSVNPGFGGQKFIPSFLRRCDELRNFLDKTGLSHVEIEVDGGVTAENAEEIARAGANILVSGSGVFGGNVSERIPAIRKAAERSRSTRV